MIKKILILSLITLSLTSTSFAYISTQENYSSPSTTYDYNNPFLRGLKREPESTEKLINNEKLTNEYYQQQKKENDKQLEKQQEEAATYKEQLKKQQEETEAFLENLQKENEEHLKNLNNNIKDSSLVTPQVNTEQQANNNSNSKESIDGLAQNVAQQHTPINNEKSQSNKTTTQKTNKEINDKEALVAFIIFIIIIIIVCFIGIHDISSSSKKNIVDNSKDGTNTKKLSNNECFNRVFPSIKYTDKKYSTTQGLVKQVNKQASTETKQSVMPREEKYQYDLTQYRKQKGIYIPPKPIPSKSRTKYTKKDIDNINDWRKFEQFVAKQFKRKNFKVILTPRTNDGGKDIIIDKNGIKTYVECKYWNSNKSIGREEIQKLAGAAMMDGVRNALFITTSTYNKNAFETAKALNKNGFNIKLWTTNDLLVFINE